MDVLHMLYFVMAYIGISFLSLYVAEHFGNSEYNKEPLPDIVHDNSNHWPPNKNIPNYLTSAIVLWTLGRLYFINFSLIGYFFAILFILILLRLPAFVFTLTPPPGKNAHCHYREVKQLFSFSFEKYGNCIDNMFSGHTAHIIIALLFILFYSKYTIEKILLVIVSLFSLFTLISAEYHYTTDVYISTIISTLLFVYVHCRFMNKI